MDTTVTAGRTARRLSTTNRVGLVVLGVLGLLDVASPFTGPAPTEPGVDGPPMGVLYLDAVLGVITVVAVVWAWRTASRTPVRLTVGARMLSVVTALPAFFVDVPSALKLLVAVFVVVSVAGVVAALWPTRSA